MVEKMNKESKRLKDRQMKRLRHSTVNGILNMEVPMGLIDKRAPKALTLNTVLPCRFTTFDLSPHHPSFHSRGREGGRNSETKQKKKESRRKHKR